MFTRISSGLFGGGNSPDNLAHNARSEHAQHAQEHNAEAVGTPKMPGEPRRVQPSRKRHDPNEID